MVARVLKVVASASLVLGSSAASGCLTRPNPCIEGGPAWLVAQCEIGGTETGSEGEEGSETGDSDTDTDTGGIPCETRGDCCGEGELDTCTQKCVPISDGRRLCYGAEFGRFNEPCDNLEAQLRDTCDLLHVCVTHVSADGGAPNEGYCKPLCDDGGACPGLPSAYTCTINGLCRRYCDPLEVNPCEPNESCRWISSESEQASRFDCQPVALDDDCVPQLKPDQPGDCAVGSMCIEELVEGLPSSRCAGYCVVGSDQCGEGVACEPFATKVPDQLFEPPHVSGIGFCPA